MITEHNETHYTDRYDFRFKTREEAEAHERSMDVKWKARVVASGEKVRASSVTAADNTKAPYTGQPNDTCRVYLFKDTIKLMQAFVDQYGPNVGLTNHHCGMGQYSDEIVVLDECEPFPGGWDNLLSAQRIITRA